MRQPPTLDLLSLSKSRCEAPTSPPFIGPRSRARR